jgi:hypothetical protein
VRLTCAHDFGDVVFLRIRHERMPGMITGIYAKPGSVSYGVTWANTGAETTHYTFELAAEFIPDYSTE